MVTPFFALQMKPAACKIQALNLIFGVFVIGAPMGRLY
jgi:hypothetical protein